MPFTVSQRWMNKEATYRWVCVGPEGETIRHFHSHQSATNYCAELNAQEVRKAENKAAVNLARATKGETLNEELMNRVREARKFAG